MARPRRPMNRRRAQSLRLRRPKEEITATVHNTNWTNLTSTGWWSSNHNARGMTPTTAVSCTTVLMTRAISAGGASASTSVLTNALNISSALTPRARQAMTVTTRDLGPDPWLVIGGVVMVLP